MTKEVGIYLNGKQLITSTDEELEPNYKVLKDYGDFVEGDDGWLYWHSKDNTAGGQVVKDMPLGSMILKDKGKLTIYHSPNYHNLGYVYIDGELSILSVKH